MEKLKLITQAVSAGISEESIVEVMQEESLIDFSINHLKEILERRAEERAEAKHSSFIKSLAFSSPGGWRSRL